MVDNHNAPSRASSSSFPARPRPAVMRVLLCPVAGVCVVLLRPPSCVVLLFGSKVFSTSGGRSRGGGGKGDGGAKPSPPRFCRHPPPATFSFTGVPLSARHLFRFVCPSPAPSPPWFSFTGGTFCFCNAELTPEQKAELVMSLKVFRLLSASFPLSLPFYFFATLCVVPISPCAFYLILLFTPRLCRTSWRGWSRSTRMCSRASLPRSGSASTCSEIFR